MCKACGYNADRDYCAALNLAGLGLTYLQEMQTTGKAQVFTVTDVASVKPCRYRPHGAVLLFPPPTPRSRLLCEGHYCCIGWKKSCTIRSSCATNLLLRLCG